MVAGWNVDGHLVGGSGLHRPKYIVRVAERGDFQAMSVEIDRIRRVWEGPCPGDRGIRGRLLTTLTFNVSPGFRMSVGPGIVPSKVGPSMTSVSPVAAFRTLLLAISA